MREVEEKVDDLLTDSGCGYREMGFGERWFTTGSGRSKGDSRGGGIGRVHRRWDWKSSSQLVKIM